MQTDDTPTDKDLALWMLDRIGHSEAAVAGVGAKLASGELDPDSARSEAAPHLGIVERLYQASGDEIVELPVELAAEIQGLQKRDLLAGREHLIEKALAALIAASPKGDAGLPKDWQTTLEGARAEVEGKTQGAFKPDFTTSLAKSARRQRDIEAKAQRWARGRDDKGRGR